MDEQMFCFQCEQAAHCTACTGKAGVCGKSADTAAAQDRLTGALISYASQLIGEGRAPAPEQALLLMEGLFTTITNVNFDPQTVDQLTESIHAACPGIGFDYDMANLWHEPDEDIRSLKSFVLFSLRGMAAYNYHARVLGRIDPELDRFFCEALQAVGSECSIDALWALVQKTGKASYRCMELLDAANTGAFGQPEPVEVPLVIEKGPFIVISGHDLYDMKCLLEQTAGKGIHVYTHSEMLPAHGYPELKQKYPHLKGNFGTAWQNQQREFEDIPAPILFTTNCIMPLRESYADRVFTTSVVSYPGVPHIGPERDFSPVIAKALELGGYPEDTAMPGINGGRSVVTGFARSAVLSHANEIVAAVKSGQIRHFFPPLLHRVRQAHPARHRDPDAGLRQIPPERPGSRNRGGPAPHPRCGPVQRRIQRHSDCAGAGRCVPVRRQRPAALAGALLVRAEGRLHPHRTAGAGHPEHPARPYPARLPLAGRGARFAGKVQSDGRHDTGAGPESDFGRRMNPFHLIIKPHKMRCDCAFTFGATVA